MVLIPNGNYEYWGSQTTNGIIPMIKIWKRDRCDEYYGTTIHELAHASHCNMDFWSFQLADKIVKESWARGVECILTKKVYSEYPILDRYSRMLYTGVVEDLISTPINGCSYIIKTSQYYYKDKDHKWVELEKSYYDQVSGYTIRQIEDSLKGSTTWIQWKNKIYNNYENSTKEYLDATFNFWNSL